MRRLDRVPIRELESGLARMALLASVVGAAVLFGVLSEGLFYASDETDWLSLSGNGSVKDLFVPAAGHLVLLPYAVGRLIFELFGNSYAIFSALGILGGIATGVLMYEYSRRRLGPTLALAPAVLMLFFGSGWPQLLQGWIGMQQLWAIAFGLGALLLVEHETRRADLLAMLLLGLSLATFSSGLAFTAGVAVAILLGNRRWARIHVWLVPVVSYGAWRLWALQFDESTGSLSNIWWLPGYFVDSLTATVAGTFGRTPLIAPGQVTALKLYGFTFNQFASAVVFAAVVIALLYPAIRAIRRRKTPRHLWPALAVLVVLWMAQGYVLEDIRTAAEPRYLYGNAIVVLLVLAAALEGARISRTAKLIAAVMVPVAILGMVPALKESHEGLLLYAREARVNLAMLELGGSEVDAGFTPATSAPGLGAPALFIDAGSYLEFAERYGSLALPLGEVKAEKEELRVKADGVLSRALAVAPEVVMRPLRCRRSSPTEVTLQLPPGGAVVRVSRESGFILRRFATGFGPSLGLLPEGPPVRLRIPVDADPTPWVLRAPSAGSLVLCGEP